jgi:hypothetical protein
VSVTAIFFNSLWGTPRLFSVVVFDDSKASVKDLTAATAGAGFPSEFKS